MKKAILLSSLATLAILTPGAHAATGANAGYHK
jgi:hypothetical protein